MSLEDLPFPSMFACHGWRRKSTEGSCVEVNYGTGGQVAVRDSKRKCGSLLIFDSCVWLRFLTRVRASESYRITTSYWHSGRPSRRDSPERRMRQELSSSSRVAGG